MICGSGGNRRRLGLGNRDGEIGLVGVVAVLWLERREREKNAKQKNFPGLESNAGPIYLRTFDTEGAGRLLATCREASWFTRTGQYEHLLLLATRRAGQAISLLKIDASINTAGFIRRVVAKTRQINPWPLSLSLSLCRNNPCCNAD